MFRYVLSFGILLTVLHLGVCQEANECAGKTTCSQCIQTPGCGWCSQIEYTNENGLENPRCNTAKQHAANRCKSSVSPDSSAEIIQDESSSVGRIVQLRPQKVNLFLRVGDEFNLAVLFAHAAEDYPVDLYYLMDLSDSMKDDKENLEHLATTIEERMEQLTSDFKLGFGSFVDKPIMPYVNTAPVRYSSSERDPYGFINHISLTTDVEQVQESVKKAKTAGNLDAPEGGFDGIMQVMACEPAIGWRNVTTRLLLYATDNSFHYAGDGKLGGIVTPNDGECHLNSSGHYTHSELLDYPSVFHINKMAIEKNLNIIFAATAEFENDYETLKGEIQGASVGILAEDSSNIVDLIEDEYKKIRSEVELQTKGSSEHIQIKFFSKCLGNTLEETNKCDGLDLQQQVEFDTRFLVTRAPENSSYWNQLITIYPVGINEALLVNLTIIADCECEHEGNPGFSSNATECNHGGDMMCGICSCDVNHYGKFCECDQSGGGNEGDVSNCAPSNSSDVLCSGRGDCSCGVCVCHEIEGENYYYQGQFCECDNFSCNRYNGLICAGSDHGVCDCGVCKCNSGWTGAACQCDNSINVCIAPGDSVKCSGHGECVCGECQCSITEQGSYYGTYCEEEPSILGLCSDLKMCVQCLVFDSGTYSTEECELNCQYDPVEVETLEAEDNEQICTFTDDDDCDFTFTYSFDKLNGTSINGTSKIPKIRVQTTKDCPPILKSSILVVIGVVAAIVGIGLALLLLWKVSLTVHDKRELAKFERERDQVQWRTEQNPLYKQATTNFNNPMFGGN